VPRALAPLLQPARYKGARGGRGGAKSHFFAEQVIVRCFQRKTRVACIREVQATIKDSVRELLVQKIQKLGIGKHFDVLETEIRGPHGSLIVFKGMQSYNAENIKSLEDFDIAWVEEAQTFSEKSLRLLRPTIRKEGSEIWFSWNTRHETDAVDKFFFGGERPKNSIVVEVNWYDNPWLPQVLIDEKDQDYATDPEMAEHVWGGGYERITAGAYYAKHIAALERIGRVGWFPYDPSLPVFTSWDLGVDDYTSIWFFQVRYIDGVPRVRIIDFYEASDMGPQEIIPAAMPEYTKDFQGRIEAMLELGREKPFQYQKHFFPHDIGNREWGAGAKTRIQTVNQLGIPLRQIARGVAQDPEERINAVRSLLPLCEFHQSKRVMIGLTHLRRYSRKMNERLGVYMGPQHDEHSHAADAFGEFAVNCGIKPPEPKEEKPKKIEPTATMWQMPPVEDTGSDRIKV
jgi:phage terminase large subunit